MINLTIIAARAKNGVIGKKNQLIWHLPEDLAFFKKTTMGFPILMGRKTYESIGRPLPFRMNVVITRSTTRTFVGCQIANSLEEALLLAKQAGFQMAFLIGGAQLYQQGLKYANQLIITEIDEAFEGDAYFPELDPHDWTILARSETYTSNTAPHLRYCFTTYQRAKPVNKSAELSS